MSFIVIGSGPSGVACAKALLAVGRSVVMLDGVTASGGRVEVKGAAMEGALGRSGLYETWQGAVLPVRQQDMAGWPVTAEELAPHVQAVMKFLPVAMERDGLESEFAVIGSSTGILPLRAQAAAVLQTMEVHREALEKAGVRFGRSRLAGRNGAYSMAQTVHRMREEENFTHLAGLMAQRVEESPNGVRVHAVDEQGGAEAIDGDRVMVAAGVLGTTTLMLRSLGVVGEYDRPVLFRQAQRFVLPMLRMSRVPGFYRKEGQHLAELFLEVMDEALSPYTVHVEVGSGNKDLAGGMGVAGKVLPVSRLYRFEGWMHSDHGPVTEGRLERNRVGGGDVLRLTVKERVEPAAILERLRLKLAGLQSEMEMVVLARWMRLGDSVDGGPLAGSFPMTHEPRGFGSDLVGRMGGLKRVHVVDASVLPTVPATTIGLAEMANAHRIGSEVGLG